MVHRVRHLNVGLALALLLSSRGSAVARSSIAPQVPCDPLLELLRHILTVAATGLTQDMHATKRVRNDVLVFQANAGRPAIDAGSLRWVMNRALSHEPILAGIGDRAAP
jgi:hypothetical protein